MKAIRSKIIGSMLVAITWGVCVLLTLRKHGPMEGCKNEKLRLTFDSVIPMRPTETVYFTV